METTEKTSSVISPITFIDRGHEHPVAAPLARITTCGMMTIEVLKEVVSLDPPLGRYEVIAAHTLRGRGAIPSLTLLKLLVSRPHRFAPKDWLSTQMHHEMDEGALVRLDTIASYLRKMLCGIEGREDNDTLRLQLVAYLRNGRGSGPGYQLGAYPLLWLDTDALAWHVEQAARMERFGHPQEALPFWERAYQLASRGTYLPDEPFSDWAVEGRGKVEGALRQSVHALHRLYLVEHGEPGEEEAILLLRTYWQSHKADEDALRPLIELLGKRERYQEAEEYYQQLCVLRKQEGTHPDPRTKDICEFLRAKQMRREPKREDQHAFLPFISASLFHHRQAGIQELSIPPASPEPTNSILTLPVSTTHQITSLETAIPDCATKFGFTLAQMIALIERWYGMALFCHDLQSQLDRNIKALETLKSQFPLEAYTLSRRSFLITLAALPTALLTSSKQTYKLVLNLEELLPQCAASITACWHLSGGNHLDAISPIIDSYLPTLITVMKTAPSYHKVAADLVAQCYFLKTILAWHLEGLDTAETYCMQAMQYSDIAKNTNLRLTALNQQALISYYAKQLQKAHSKSEEAYAMLQNTSHEYIFPIVQGRVCMYLAALQAQQLRGKAEQTLEQAQAAVAEPVPLYADCGDASLTLWDGLTHYYLSFHDAVHAEQALTALETFGQLQSNIRIPERFRLECLNNRILAAAQCNKMEEAISCLEAGKQGASALKSNQRNAEVGHAYQEMLKRWPKEERVRMLGTSHESLQLSMDTEEG